MRRPGKAQLARAAMTAFEPLVQLFLELGVTSPEAESLLRGVFVHRARAWLERRDARAERATDVRIALVTGVHRNFVHRILSEPPRIAAAREQKGHRTDRLLEAWHTDPRYLDSSGKPRDLFETGQEPSFHALAQSCVPGAAPSLVLAELRRAGLVQTLSEHRVRVRQRTFRPTGINAAGVGELAARGRELLETLTHNLRRPAARRFCDSMPALEIDVRRAAYVRDLITRRAGSFLAAMAEELAVEGRLARRRRNVRRIAVGLTAIQTEQGSGGPDPEDT